MTSLGFRPVDRPRTHGLWLDRRSWEGWKRRFVRRGHQVMTPRLAAPDGIRSDRAHVPSVTPDRKGTQ